MYISCIAMHSFYFSARYRITYYFFCHVFPICVRLLNDLADLHLALAHFRSYYLVYSRKYIFICIENDGLSAKI